MGLRRIGALALIAVALASCSSTHVSPSSALQSWLTGLGVAGVLVFLIIALTQRGRPGFEFTGRGPLRFYFYLASLIAAIVITTGVADLMAVVLSAPFGVEAVYGTNTQGGDAAQFRREDLLRGATYVLIGALFWAVNFYAQRGFLTTDDRASGAYRTYLFIGTSIFGIATIVQLPSGLNSLLAQALGITGATYTGYFEGYGSLAGGLAALPVWLLYLWRARKSMLAASPAALATA